MLYSVKQTSLYPSYNILRAINMHKYVCYLFHISSAASIHKYFYWSLAPLATDCVCAARSNVSLAPVQCHNLKQPLDHKAIHLRRHRRLQFWFPFSVRNISIYTFFIKLPFSPTCTIKRKSWCCWSNRRDMSRNLRRWRSNSLLMKSSLLSNEIVSIEAVDKSTLWKISFNKEKQVFNLSVVALKSYGLK